MERLQGNFWTSEKEMIEELEDLGFDVLDITYEYIEIMDIDERMEDEPETLTIPLIRVRSTIALDI